jgi:multidrug resistance efflux pump
MNAENHISPEELKNNAGGRANGAVIDFSLNKNSPIGGWGASVTEIMSQPPSWLVQWGITVFFGILLLILAVSWWVRYPELIKGNLKIVANDLPKSVIARSEGRLMTLFVKDGQQVQKSQLLAQMETTAQPIEVSRLGTLTDSLVKMTLDGNLSRAYSVEIPPFFELGELQKSYQTFQEAFIRTKAFVGSGAAFQKKGILSNDLVQMQALETHLQRQLHDQKSDLSLVESDLKMNEKLLAEKVISRTEYRQALSKFLNKKQSVEQSESQLKNNQLTQNQKQQEMLELERTIGEQQNTFLQSLRALKSDIEAWKQRYQALAPTTGKVTFVQTIQEGQALKTGQELFYVLPHGAGFGGEMNIGQYNLGKVKVGQEVIVKLNSYPFEQFGTVRGRLSYISDLPRDSTYWARVTFPQGLKTSNQRTVPFRNGLLATAEIITEDRSLFEQFFYEFLRVFQRK